MKDFPTNINNEAGNPEPQVDDNVRLETAKKIEAQYQKEFMDSLKILTQTLAEFINEIRGNKFNRLPFDLDGLERLAYGEFDTQKITEAFVGITRVLRKDFVPEDSRDRMSIEPHNYSRGGDLLDDLKGKLISFRVKIESGKLSGDDKAGTEAMRTEVIRAINAIVKQQDHLADMRIMLLRLSDR